MKNQNDYVTASSMIDTIRNFKLNEDTNTAKGTIAITNDVRFGQNVLKNQKDAFINAVDGGTQFSGENPNHPNENPLVYIPETGNLIFSGMIPSMNNLRWQFSLKDSDGIGCFFWADGLRLTEQNLATLRKLQGYYLNWRDQWQREGSLLDMISKE